MLKTHPSLPILLTGASGVVGSEITRHFPVERLLLGRHRAKPIGSSPQVAIDIRKPQLGRSEPEYQALTEGISGIIHSAAITEMSSADEGLYETNIEGVSNIIALAKSADVPLHYISTAYCSNSYAADLAAESEYIGSKREAERLVRESGLDWTIIRPSIVAGHSHTGEIASFQGFHLFITSILKDRLPIIPLDPKALCDFIPVDYVARAIVQIAAQPKFGHTYWLTSGINAVNIADMLDYGKPFAKELGRDLSGLSMSYPAATGASRAMAGGLPKRMQERFKVMADLSQVMAIERPFPSDFSEVLAGETLLDSQGLLRSLGHNLHYWGRAMRHAFKTKP